MIYLCTTEIAADSRALIIAELRRIADYFEACSSTSFAHGSVTVGSTSHIEMQELPDNPQ